MILNLSYSFSTGLVIIWVTGVLEPAADFWNREVGATEGLVASQFQADKNTDHHSHLGTICTTLFSGMWKEAGLPIEKCCWENMQIPHRKVQHSNPGALKYEAGVLNTSSP